MKEESGANAKARRITGKMKAEWTIELDRTGHLYCPMIGCFKKFVTVANFQTHYKWCTGKTDLRKCPYCDSLIITAKKSVYQHMETFHPEKAEEYKKNFSGTDSDVECSSSFIVSDNDTNLMQVEEITESSSKSPRRKNSSKENNKTDNQSVWKHKMKSINEAAIKNIDQFQKCVRFDTIVDKIKSVDEVVHTIEELNSATTTIKSPKVKKIKQPIKRVPENIIEKQLYFEDPDDSVDDVCSELYEKRERLGTKSLFLLDNEFYKRYHENLTMTRDWASARKTYTRSRNSNSASDSKISMQSFSDSSDVSQDMQAIEEPLQLSSSPVKFKKNTPDLSSSDSLLPTYSVITTDVQDQHQLKESFEPQVLNLHLDPLTITCDTLETSEETNIDLVVGPNEQINQDFYKNGIFDSISNSFVSYDVDLIENKESPTKKKLSVRGRKYKRKKSINNAVSMETEFLAEAKDEKDCYNANQFRKKSNQKPIITYGKPVADEELMDLQSIPADFNNLLKSSIVDESKANETTVKNLEGRPSKPSIKDPLNKKEKKHSATLTSTKLVPVKYKRLKRGRTKKLNKSKLNVLTLFSCKAVNRKNINKTKQLNKLKSRKQTVSSPTKHKLSPKNKKYLLASKKPYQKVNNFTNKKFKKKQNITLNHNRNNKSSINFSGKTINSKNTSNNSVSKFKSFSEVSDFLYEHSAASYNKVISNVILDCETSLIEYQDAGEVCTAGGLENFKTDIDSVPPSDFETNKVPTSCENNEGLKESICNYQPEEMQIISTQNDICKEIIQEVQLISCSKSSNLISEQSDEDIRISKVNEKKDLVFELSQNNSSENIIDQCNVDESSNVDVTAQCLGNISNSSVGMTCINELNSDENDIFNNDISSKDEENKVSNSSSTAKLDENSKNSSDVNTSEIMKIYSSDEQKENTPDKGIFEKHKDKAIKEANDVSNHQNLASVVESYNDVENAIFHLSVPPPFDTKDSRIPRPVEVVLSEKKVNKENKEADSVMAKIQNTSELESVNSVPYESNIVGSKIELVNKSNSDSGFCKDISIDDSNKKSNIAECVTIIASTPKQNTTNVDESEILPIETVSETCFKTSSSHKFEQILEPNTVEPTVSKLNDNVSESQNASEKNVSTLLGKDTCLSSLSTSVLMKTRKRGRPKSKTSDSVPNNSPSSLNKSDLTVPEIKSPQSTSTPAPSRTSARIRTRKSLTQNQEGNIENGSGNSVKTVENNSVNDKSENEVSPTEEINSLHDISLTKEELFGEKNQAPILKRSRGRPRKNSSLPSILNTSQNNLNSSADNEVQNHNISEIENNNKSRKISRPKKYLNEFSEVSCCVQNSLNELNMKDSEKSYSSNISGDMEYKEGKSQIENVSSENMNMALNNVIEQTADVLKNTELTTSNAEEQTINITKASKSLKKRGRPRKYPQIELNINHTFADSIHHEKEFQKLPKKRGRPSKKLFFHEDNSNVVNSNNLSEELAANSEHYLDETNKILDAKFRKSPRKGQPKKCARYAYINSTVENCDQIIDVGSDNDAEKSPHPTKLKGIKRKREPLNSHSQILSEEETSITDNSKSFSSKLPVRETAFSLKGEKDLSISHSRKSKRVRQSESALPSDQAIKIGPDSSVKTSLGENADIILEAVKPVETFTQPKEKKLFQHFKSKKGLWKALSESEQVQYYPPLVKSMPLKVSETDIELNCFESATLEESKSYAFFTGAPIWTSAWCPTPVDKKAEQYLAIATSGSLAEHHSYIADSESKTLVQFWNLGFLNDFNLVQSPLLQLCLAFNYGNIFDMTWCPKGCWDDPSESAVDTCWPRLGLLAIASSDSFIRVYSVPHPKFTSNEASNFPLFDSSPLLVLEPLYSNTGSLTEKSACVSLNWDKTGDSERIAAGYANGLICIWLLNTSSTLLTKGGEGNILVPYLVFNAHGTPVTSLSFAFIMKSKWLISTSYEREVKFWDLTQPSMPIAVVKDGYAGNVHVAALNSSAIINYNENISLRASQFLKDLSLDSSSLILLDDTTVTERKTAYSELMNALAIVDDTGTITAKLMQPQHGIGQDLDTAFPRRQIFAGKAVIPSSKPVNDNEIDTLALYDALAVNTITWSPNNSSSFWLLAGGTSGVARLCCFHDLKL